jgi:nitroimidazol reductase NimA-like FMN-containing flavoprotein (pyridoxamine 5'-phosphate oxidase superfamily)
MWSDADEAVLAGDLTAALAYVTPAGGAVVTPVAPVGLRDRAAQTVSFTTSLGFGRKLDRIKQNPKVALAYHAREHGFADGERFVLVQGTASYDSSPDRAQLEALEPAARRFMGKRAEGAFWDRWLSAYYGDRVVVSVAVERVCAWPDLSCAGTPEVSGAPLAQALEPQAPPRLGAGPRVDVARAARRLARLPHVLLGYVGADGLPVIVPVRVGSASERGIALEGPLPGGARRAGLLGHSYRAQLIGLESRQYTGWLDGSTYAPHTESGFRAPANKTLLLLANGFMARRGLKRARAVGRS